MQLLSKGWVYTRALGRSTAALGRLRKHHMEAETLQSLLAQSANFCPSSRGRWWSRLILLLERYIGEDGLDQRQQHAAQIARMALEDDPWLQGGTTNLPSSMQIF
jgi:hypothetical protein